MKLVYGIQNNSLENWKICYYRAFTALVHILTKNMVPVYVPNLPLLLFLLPLSQMH